jgi:hypothetical protein
MGNGCNMKGPQKIQSQSIHAKGAVWVYLRDTCTPMVTAALFTIAKIQRQSRSPTTELWIKQMCL